MTRVRCLFKHCLFNEDGTCVANEIELDEDGRCLTLEESEETAFRGTLSEDSELLDQWDEDEDEEWEEGM